MSSVWHPFTQHGLGEPIPLVRHAKDALIHTADGRSFIDAISSWWVTTHGHCNPRIMAAIAEQAGMLGLSAEQFNRAQMQALAFAETMEL
jgi:adenosylmethionine-8-amino-7-oxononanoate aminotransferase